MPPLEASKKFISDCADAPFVRFKEPADTVKSPAVDVIAPLNVALPLSLLSNVNMSIVLEELSLPTNIKSFSTAAGEKVVCPLASGFISR